MPAHLTDAATWGIEKVTGQPAGTYADSYKLADTDLGKAFTAEAYAEGEAPRAVDALRTAGDWGAGGALSKASKVSTVPDVIMAAGAGGGQYLGGDEGEMLGGLGSLPFAIISAMRGNANPAQKITSAEKRAVEYIDGIANIGGDKLSDQLPAIIRAANMEGETGGSLAQITGVSGLADLEKLLGTKSTMAHKIKEAQQAFIPSQVDNAQVAVTGGDDASGMLPAAREAFDTTEDAIQAEATARLAGAMTQEKAAEAALQGSEAMLGQAKTAVSSGARPSESSVAASARLKELDDANHAKNVKPLYDQIASDTPIDTSQAANNAISAIKDRLVKSPAATKAVMKKVGLNGLVKKFKEGGLPQDLRFELMNMKAKVDKLYKSSEGGITSVEAGDAKKILNILEKELKDAVPAYKLADEAYTAHRAKFRGSEVGGVDSKSLAEEFGKRLSATGEKGAVVRDDLARIDDPQLTGEVGNYLRGVFDRDHSVGAKGAEGFLKKYDEVLDLYPDLRKEVEGVVVGEQGIKQSTSALAKATKQAKEADRSLNFERGAGMNARAKTVLGRYTNEPNDTISNLLSSRDSVDDISRLNADLKNIGQEGKLKTTLVDELSKRVRNSSNTQSAIDKNIEIVDKLELSRVISPTDASRLRNSLNRIGGAKGLLSDADMRGIEGTMSGTKNILASIAAGVASGGFSSSHRLMLTGAFRREILKMMDGGSKGNVEIAEMLADPQKYLTAASKTKAHADDTTETLKRMEAELLSRDSGLTADKIAEGIGLTPEMYKKLKASLIQKTRTPAGLSRAMQTREEKQNKSK